jgi:predicted TIM-barrel fold metal-dependent hydrolase
MDRIGVEEAWLSNLSAVFWKDPTEGNALLYSAVEREDRLHPVPAVHPDLPNWNDVLGEAVQRDAPAVRADPTFYGVDPSGAGMRELAAGCAEAGLPLLLAVRLEDGRQRHPNDRAAELSPHAVRALVRSHPRVRLIVTHADREFIEQVHFGSTPAEAARILWDICWIWGPPEDHLALLLETVGGERFTFGTGMPLRIPENSVAKLDLLDQTPEDRLRIESGNLKQFLEVSS